MLYLRSWLENYIDLSKISNQELSDLISLNSGEVEEFFEVSDWFDGKVVVGKIENSRKHPDASRLQIFDVDLGSKGKVQIVSAAPNVEDGKVVPVALIGAKLAYMTILERKMRGQTSQGMCLGKSELMLETDYSMGLWELEKDIKSKGQEVILGQSICEAFPELFPTQDVFDIKYLQDRIGTLGSHLGLALEISYVLKNRNLLKPKASRILETDQFYNEFQEKALQIQLSDKKAEFNDDTGYTNIFSLFEVDLNPQNKQDYQFYLPHQNQQRMFFCGKNLIGGVADLSNYLLFDVGQPSHFFNLQNRKKLNWQVKKLKEPKKFVGLGQLKNVQIPKNIEVIQEDNEIIWIPGISGSETSKITEKDTNFGIEIANFEKERVAQSSFTLNYRSDSARFWNSNVNIPLILIWILHLFENLESLEKPFVVKIILNWSNPNHPIHKFTNSTENHLEFFRSLLEFQAFYRIEFDKNYLATRIDFNSLNENLEIVEKYLPQIGKIEGNFLSPNIFYGDFASQEEILFEIVKLNGLNNLKDSYLTFNTNSTKDKYLTSILNFKKFIVSFGFSEIISRPLVSEKNLLNNLLENENQSLKAISTQRQDENRLKDSLIPQLLEIASMNISRGEKDISIFEMERVYRYTNKLQEYLFCDIISFTQNPINLTTLLHNLANRVKKSINYEKLKNNLGEGYKYKIGDKIIAELLQVKNKIKKKYQIPLTKTLWILHFDLSNWDMVFNKYNRFKDESEFPKLTRSISLEINNDYLWSEISEVILDSQNHNFELKLNPTERLEIEGSLVVNFDAEFLNYERNLTHQEVDQWQESTILKLQKKFPKIKLR